MKIAKRTPKSGAPSINLASVFGATVEKEFMLRIPVTGKAPIKISVASEHDGLSFDGKVISGKIDEICKFTVAVKAENDEGMSEKQIRFIIDNDTALLTPLLGFTTWNAYGENVSEKKVLAAAQKLLDERIPDYGYSYMNIDSGWQKEYGGKYNAIMPNEKFPDMKKLCDTLHALGYNCGIYSTPMLMAWGCPPELPSIPGCTVGEPDERFPRASMRIGKIHLEENNVRQWTQWGFDYLKYDWSPTDTENADLMKKALLKSSRHFAYCVTTYAELSDAEYWNKNVNSWRLNSDSAPVWDNVKTRFYTISQWLPHIKAGHFYDLDMLEIGGICFNGETYSLTTDEEVFTYTMRAFFMSPIQISADPEKLTDVQLDIFCNEEIIAINSDPLCDIPKLIAKDGGLSIYERKLETGETAMAVFNTDDVPHTVELSVGDSKLIRDVWAKENITVSGKFKIRSEPHTSLVYRIKK